MYSLGTFQNKGIRQNSHNSNLHCVIIIYFFITFCLFYLNHLSNNLSSFSFRSSIFCSIISNRDDPALLVLAVPLSKLKPRPRFALRSSLIQIYKLMVTGHQIELKSEPKKISGSILKIINLTYCAMIRALKLISISNS